MEGTAPLIELRNRRNSRVLPTLCQFSSEQNQVSDRSPTMALLLGLLITLVTVVAYSWYITLQMNRLRSVEKDFAGRNRKDSLQLLRVHNDFNSLALAMRDMLDGNEPYPLTAWSVQFQRIHEDLDDALRLEDQFAVGHRTPEQRKYLGNSLAQFWDAVDRTFSLAKAGREKEARAQIRLSLQARQQALSSAVARLLVENNESEEHTAAYINRVYDGVQQQAYVFLTGTLAAILLTGLSLTYSNRRLFGRLSMLSDQRSELAQKLIATQESTLRYVSRELHDEFGQILTAIGAMICRMQNQSPPASTLRSELLEIRDITQSTLEKVRGLSQALHPVTLDEADLPTTLEWYLPSLERQTGIAIDYQKSGPSFQLDSTARIHAYRVVQEALSNIIRHSGTMQAWVRLKYRDRDLVLEVEDHGVGIRTKPSQHGIGLIGMRERAELVGGTIEFLRPAHGGTEVCLSLPRLPTDGSEN